GKVAITPTGVLLVCGSLVMFSAYALLSDRVVPHTDSLTAATWTAIGASLGVTLFGAARSQLEVPSSGALAALVANGIATAAAFTLFFMVLDRIGPTRTDRKSTRLNSSHRTISYAVFCLKKKKNKTYILHNLV